MGKKVIIENFENNGIKIESLVFCGGIPYKNKLLNQIYADVLNKTIIVSSELEAAAKSSAIFATLASGRENGGYDSIQDAVAHTVVKSEEIYQPNINHVEIYQKLYDLYKHLSAECAQTNSVMKKLLWTRLNENKK